MASTPPYQDGLQWITAYVTIHSLSVPSRRYPLLLWLAVVFISLSFAVLHWTGSRGGLCGAIWSKWALRRRTWQNKHALALARKTNRPHRQPVSLPPNAQLLSLTVLTLASLALAFVGPDYLDPSLKVWQMARSSPPSQLYDTSTFVPYMPQYTISKSLWSSSARVGQIAFALFPLCVLLALKAPPFAIFAIPFMMQLYFDKLAWLHRWAGRLIWFLALIHVILWSIQLAKDVNPSTGRVAYVYAWSYTPFIFGWIAFALLSLIILLSLHPIRRRFYECFYVSHVILVPCMLVTAGLHHPTIAWWCWATLFVWIGERFWRGIRWLYANGIVPGVTLRPYHAPSNFKKDTWEMDDVHRFSVDSTPSHLRLIDERSPSPLDAYFDKTLISADCDTPTSEPRSPASLVHSAEQNPSKIPISYAPFTYIPPSGYAHAELLSGHTMRLRLITPGSLSWSPGQHFLLNIPSVSRFTSHPFTCATVCDEEAPTDAGRIMLFLVRTKRGWTQDLWKLVSQMTAERSSGDVSPGFASGNLPKNGVLLRAYVDGPFGSAKRARWGNYSTGVIVAGGSGVSFGLSLLQYMCMCLAGKNGRHLGGRPSGWGCKGAELKRVRFIWLVREYSHVQWGASIIRHCMSIVPPSVLQVDIYITNFKPIPLRHPSPLVPPRAHFNRESAKSDETLQPPHPNFIRENSLHSRSGSTDSVRSHDSHESDVDLNYYLGESPHSEPAADDIHIAHETNILDLTNFDGDIDMASPGEAYLSRRLKNEWKFRRMKSRKLSVAERMDHDARSPHPLVYGEAQTPRHAQDPRQDQYKTPSQSSRVPWPSKILTLSIQSTDRLHAISTLSERPKSSSSERDSLSPLSHHSESSLHPYSPLKSMPLSSDFPSPASLITTHDDSRSPTYPAKSHYDVKSGFGKSQAVQIPPSTPNGHARESRLSPLSNSGASDSQLPFEMDEQEATDVSFVCEHARPGKPKLDKVIADEVQASRGAIVVACCGPTSLNVMVRKIVATQIDPGRIWGGDMRGSITLISEEFEY